MILKNSNSGCSRDTLAPTARNDHGGNVGISEHRVTEFDDSGVATIATAMSTPCTTISAAGCGKSSPPPGPQMTALQAEPTGPGWRVRLDLRGRREWDAKLHQLTQRAKAASAKARLAAARTLLGPISECGDHGGIMDMKRLFVSTGHLRADTAAILNA
jgi:hypothetical protein